MEQLIDALAQGERRSGDEHAEGRDQRPEVGLPPVSQRMLSVGRAAAAALRYEQGQVVAAVGERMRGLGGQSGRTSEDRCPDLGQRDPQEAPTPRGAEMAASFGPVPQIMSGWSFHASPRCLEDLAGRVISPPWPPLRLQWALTRAIR